MIKFPMYLLTLLLATTQAEFSCDVLSNRHEIICPPFCVRIRRNNGSDGVLSLCNHSCSSPELLFPDGRCHTVEEACGSGRSAVRDEKGFLQCVTSTGEFEKFENACGCASRDDAEFHACPGFTEIEVDHYSHLYDLNPPSNFTLSTCWNSLGNSGAYKVLPATKPVDFGLLQCPQPVPKPAPGVGYSLIPNVLQALFWIWLVSISVVGSSIVVTWIIIRYTRAAKFPEHRLRSSPQNYSLFESVIRNEPSSQRIAGGSAIQAVECLGLPATVVCARGYRRSVFGKTALISYCLLALLIPLLSIIQILDIYGVFGSWLCPEAWKSCDLAWTLREGWRCGTKCLFPAVGDPNLLDASDLYWPFRVLSRKDYSISFLILWASGLVSLIILLSIRNLMTGKFRFPVSLGDAESVEIKTIPKQYYEDLARKKNWVRAVADWQHSRAAYLQGRNINLCEVHLDVDGTQYFDYESTRYFWNGKSYVRYEITLDLDRCSDPQYCLNSKEAKINNRTLGLNLVTFESIRFWRNIVKNELLSLNFIFQIYCLLVWYFFHYWIAATVVLVTIIVAKSLRAYTTWHSLSRLKAFTDNVTQTTVFRDESIFKISSTEVTVGDIISPELGVSIPADCILVAGSCLVNESSITGEAVPLPKSSGELLFAGTKLVSWIKTKSVDLRCRAVVIRIGSRTLRGQLVQNIMNPDPVLFNFEVQWPLVFLLLFVWGSINMIVGAAFLDWEIEGWILGIFTISQALSPLIPSVFIAGQAIGAKRLFKEHNINCVNLPRTMVAGKVTFCCFDKTGTLTESGLKIDNVVAIIDHTPSQVCYHDGRALANGYPLLYAALSSCHEIEITNSSKLVGHDLDLTMFSFTRATLAEGNRGSFSINGHNLALSVLRRYPFSRDTMTASVVVRDVRKGVNTIFTKGAYESLKTMLVTNSPDFSFKVDSLAADGHYIIAVGARNLSDEHYDRSTCQSQLSLIGLILFKNELHPDTYRAITDLHRGNCQTVMITGDNPLTACRVALDCGILQNDKPVLILNSTNSGILSCYRYPGNHPADVNQRCLHLQNQLVIVGCETLQAARKSLGPDWFLGAKIFARMSPSNKSEVVRLFKSKGITAMIGDGANDVEALENAHCGLAVSCELHEFGPSLVAHFATADSGISSAVNMIRHGRGTLAATFGAYKHLIVYGEIMVMLSAIEMFLKVIPPEAYWIFVDTVVNAIMTWAILATKPAKRLSRIRPTSSLFSWSTFLSVINVVVVNWVFMIGGMIFLFRQPWFQCRKFDTSSVAHEQWWRNGDNYEASTLALLGLFQWISTGPIFSTGKGFRRRWIQSWQVVSLWAIFLIIGLYLIWGTADPITCLFRTNCGDLSLIQHWKQDSDLAKHLTTYSGKWSSPLIPPGCPCDKQIDPLNNPTCEHEYKEICSHSFHQRFHHNIFPIQWRWILTAIVLLNIAMAFSAENVVHLFRRCFLKFKR